MFTNSYRVSPENRYRIPRDFSNFAMFFTTFANGRVSASRNAKPPGIVGGALTAGSAASRACARVTGQNRSVVASPLHAGMGVASEGDHNRVNNCSSRDRLRSKYNRNTAISLSRPGLNIMSPLRLCEVFACFGSSHDFLSAIFGIFGQFGIGIGDPKNV